MPEDYPWKEQAKGDRTGISPSKKRAAPEALEDSEYLVGDDGDEVEVMSQPAKKMRKSVEH